MSAINLFFGSFRISLVDETTFQPDHLSTTMSNIHNLEPQAYGVIILKTTFGDLEVELFTKQCPKATKNFVQLCLDGYYNGTIFNRVEKDFIAIGGVYEDGDNIDQETFSDEFHSRLKFSRRGLLATANTQKDENGAEFFFTLGPAPELQNKHTIFGRAKGDSVYVLVDLNDCHVDDEDLRPLNEKKIIEALVVENPFPELTPRLDRVNLIQALRAKDNDKHSRTDDDDYDPLNRPKPDPAKVKKLSFYQDDSDDEDIQDQLTPDNGSADKRDAQINAPNVSNVTSDLKTEPTKRTIQDDVGNKTSDSEGDSKRMRLEESTKSPEDEREKRLRELRSQIQNIRRQIESETETKTLSAKHEQVQKTTIEVRNRDDANTSMTPEQTTDGLRIRIAPAKGRQREKETLQLVHNFKRKLREASKKSSNERRDVKTDDDHQHDNDLDLLDKVDGDEWLSHRFKSHGDDIEDNNHRSSRRSTNRYSPEHSDRHSSTTRRAEWSHDRDRSRR